MVWKCAKTVVWSCTLQWGNATVMMSSALTSSVRTVCPVRACFALTANFVMSPFMRRGRNQVTTTKEWFWANAVKLVTSPGAERNVCLNEITQRYKQIHSSSMCLRIPTGLSCLYIQRFTEGSNSSRRYGCYLQDREILFKSLGQAMIKRITVSTWNTSILKNWKNWLWIYSWTLLHSRPFDFLWT